MEIQLTQSCSLAPYNVEVDVAFTTQRRAFPVFHQIQKNCKSVSVGERREGNKENARGMTSATRRCRDM